MDLDLDPLLPLQRTPHPQIQQRAAGMHFQLYAAISGGAVLWRLLSGNNRDLGRSSAGFPDSESCVDAIISMLSLLSILQPSVKPAPKNQWVWALRDSEGSVQAVSGHTYDRQIRCEQGRAQFVRMAPTASIGRAVMVSRTRRWS
jgi:hypothetical protein